MRNLNMVGELRSLACLLFGLAALWSAPARAQGIFIRGDCTQDLRLDIADPVDLLSFLYLGGARPICLDACDFDDSELNELSDAIGLLNFLYLGGSPPPPPFPREDLDPAGDLLDCLNGRLPVLELRVAPAELTFYRKGDSQPLTVIGLTGGGGLPRLVDLREDPRTSYRIDRPEVARVSSAGVVTAVEPGKAAITVEHRHLSARTSVRVVGSADGSPVLRIVAPPEGAVVTSPSITAAGMVSDRSAQVTVGGAAASVDPVTGAFSARIALSPGPARITIEARGAGGSAQAEVRVVRAVPGSPEAVGPDGAPLPELPPPYITPSDRTAPRVEILSPRSGAVLASGQVEVRVGVDDPQAVVRVNLVTAVEENGTFSARISLPRGASRIEAEAIDPVGNRSTSTVEVTVDFELPWVAIGEPPLTDLLEPGTFPEGVALAARSPIEVRGTVSGPGMRVWINGVPAAVSGTAFSGSAGLERGLNRVAVLAELSGDPPRRVAAVRRVFLDLDPPRLEITYPPEGYTATGSSLPVAGRVLDPGAPAGAKPLELRVNGSPVEVSGGGFETSLALVPGRNSISLRAMDLVGRETARDLTVLYDVGGGPSLELWSGGSQTALLGAELPRPLVVRARGVGGRPESGVAVLFRVTSGDGLLPAEMRERQVMTDASGEARLTFRAGLAAGRGLHVVTARALGRRGSPIGFIATVRPGPLAALAAHSHRWETGTAGFPFPRLLSVRALDLAGNPLAGVPVEFEILSGAARLSGGPRLALTTGRGGLAATPVELAGGEAVDTRSTVAASAPGGFRVTFTVDSRAPGPPADTRLAGMITDPAGAPLSGIAVRSRDLPALEAATDLRGRFELAEVPAGPLLLEVLSSPRHAGTWREVTLVSGRRNLLPEPLRLIPIPGGPRMAEVTVSEISGATAAVPAVPGMRLEVAPGAARFPDGSRRGRVALAAAGLSMFGSAVPDWSGIEFPAAILPEGVRFDPPARLFIPNPRHEAGREVPLLHFELAAGGFVEAGRGRVGEDRAFIESLEGMGVAGGGVAVFALPGPAGGGTTAVEGKVAIRGPGTSSAAERAESPVVGANVYAHSGEFFLEAVDLTIPGRGLEYRFRRRYESRHALRGSLGPNWEHEYADRRLEPLPGPGNLLRCDGNGRFDEYLRSSSSPVYIAPVGVFARLFMGPGGSLIERVEDGTRYTYHPLDGSGRSGKLIQIADRSGNRISIFRDERGRISSVLDTMGRSIGYEYDAEDRIRRVSDFAGRAVEFTYDSQGDLVAVTGPSITGTPNGNDFPSGRTVRYEYLSGTGDRRLDHNLIRIFAPSEAGGGPPRLVNHYDQDPSSAAFDRVVAQDWGGRNASEVDAGGRLHLQYRLVSRPADGEAPEEDPVSGLLAAGGTTIVTDRRGHRSEIDWNRLGLATAIRRYTGGDLRPRDPGSLHPAPGIDPPFFETRHRYTPEGLVAETVFPRGNRVIYERDEGAPLRWSRSKVVREIRHPAPGAAGTPSVTTCRYDPFFGQRIREVPPRGNDPQYSPPNGGQPSPDRYATVRFLDYQEGNEVRRLAAEAGLEVDLLIDALLHSGLSLGLGDLNGDGDTSGTSGHIVRTVYPPVVLPDGAVQEAVETAVYNHLGQLESLTDPVGAVTRSLYHPETDPDGDGEPNQSPGLNSTTGGYLAERVVDADPGGQFLPARLRTSWTYDRLGRPVRRTDGRGHATELLWNAAGELVQYRAPAPLGYRRRFRYDSNGDLVGLAVENFTANLEGFPLQVAENPWIEASWTRDILGRVVEERREVSAGEGGPARWAVTAYRYDPNGNLERVIHPEGNEERFAHDERDLILLRVRGGGAGLDPGGEAIERFDHDENQNLTRITAPLREGQESAGEVTEYRYDGFDRLSARIDAAGGEWLISRDPEGRIVSESFLGSPGGPPGGDGKVLLFRRERLHDERGREYRTSVSRFGPGVSPGAGPASETRFFDRAGRLVRRIDPVGGSWTEERDRAGRPARSTDPDGNSVSRLYDPSGNLLVETRADLSSRVIDAAAGAAGDPDYDAAGRLKWTSTTAYVHDALHRLSVSIDGAGRTHRYRYRSDGNVVHSTDAVGTVLNAGTDPELGAVLPHLARRQADRANAHGNRTHYRYDGLGRLVAVVHELRKGGEGQRDLDHSNPFNPDGLIEERFEWDGNGRLAGWTDDRGNRTIVTYDRLDRPRVRVDPDGGEERYDYDLRGNLVKVTGRDGTFIRQRFDALGRLVRREVEPQGEGGPEGTRLQIFEYDGLGRPTLAFDQNRPEDPADDAVVVRGYDSLGGLAFECQGPYAVEHQKDAAGRPTSITYPDGRTLYTPRDSLGRVSEIHDGAWSHVAFHYLGPDRILRRALGNGLRQEYLERDTGGILRLRGYGRAGEVEREEYRNAAGEMVLGLDHGYDRAGRRLFERRLHREGRGPALRYDSIGRPQEIQPDLFDPRSPPLNPTRFTRLYPDGAHNPRLTIADFSETRIEVDLLDRLTSVAGVPLFYDAAGNLLAAGGVELRFDAFGRLTRILKDGAEALRLAWDAVGAWSGFDFRLRGRPALRDEPAEGRPAGQVRTVFTGDRPIEERLETGGPLRQYVHGPDGRLVSALELSRGGEVLFYLGDGAGSVAGIADGRGALIEEVDYGPSGSPTFRAPGQRPRETSFTGNRLLHGTRRWEPTARLYEIGARHYSPALGRFISPGGPRIVRDSLAMNRYAFLDPVNGFRPALPETESAPAELESPEPPSGGGRAAEPRWEVFLPAVFP